MSCSIIVSTYNRPDALQLTLESIERQSVLPNEVIVADDGSGPETLAIIQKFGSNSKLIVKHCWQEDEGFRLARVRNLALKKAVFQYIIQIDGDLILHPDFVKDHLYFAKRGYFTRGCRVELRQSITEAILRTMKVPVLTISHFEHYKAANGTASKIMLWFLRLLRKPSNGVLGCNMAYSVEDAKAINGFNNDFEGWGAEDDEFAIRLLNHGVKMQTLKFGAIVYHLWHRAAERTRFDENVQLLEKVRESGEVWCGNGLQETEE